MAADIEYKAFVRELYEPLLDELVDVTYELYGSLLDSFPDSTPESQRLSTLETVVKSQVEMLKGAFKSIVPKDLTEKVKEAYNGGE